MIHNFIKSFKNEKLKNVLHTVFAKYDSNNTKVDGLNDHIENILNTVDKNDIAELNKALNEINSGEEFEKVYDEELEEINDSNEIVPTNKIITNELTKNAKKTLEDKFTVESFASASIIPSSPAPDRTNEIKNALTDKAKKILETNLIDALSKVASTVTAPDDVINNALMNKANPKKVLILCQRKSSTTNGNVKPISDRINQYVKNVMGNNVNIEYLTHDKQDTAYEADYKFILDSNNNSEESNEFIKKNKETYSLIILNTCPLIFMNYKDIYNLLEPDGIMVFKHFDMNNDNHFDEERKKEIIQEFKDKEIEKFINEHFDEMVNSLFGIFAYKKKDKEAVKMDVTSVDDVVETKVIENDKYIEEINICKKFPRKRFGIENPVNPGKGQQCYSNALFQMLYSMPTMRKIFTEININDTTDSIGLLVKRFKDISKKGNETFTIGQNEGNTCLSRYFRPTNTNLKYTHQNDTAELCEQIIVTSLQLRIYKYIFELHNANINEITYLDGIPKEIMDKINSSIVEKLQKIYSGSFIDENGWLHPDPRKEEYIKNALEELFQKYRKKDITEDEKKIFFNEKVNNNINIKMLFDFIESIDYKYKTQLICENDDRVDSVIVLQDSYKISIINENTKKTITSIQDAIEYEETINIEDETNISDECGKISSSNIVKKKIYKVSIPENNKYLIIQLKRFITKDNTQTIKIPHEVEPNKKIFIDEKTYTLTGVIFHIGKTTNSGHYIYIQCNENGDYHYIFNDSQTEPYDTNGQFNETFINKNGYVFLYSRYPVDQYNPENKANPELIAKKKEELNKLNVSLEEYSDWDKRLVELFEIKRKIKKGEKLTVQDDINYNKINETTKNLKIYDAIDSVKNNIARKNELKQDIKNLEKEIELLSNNDT